MLRSGDEGIHYSTVVKTTAGRPLIVGRMCYMRGGAFNSAHKAL